MRTGEYSIFTSPTGIVDSFTDKSKGDVITSYDWNKLGDSIYRLENAILELKEKESTSFVNKNVRFWTETFSPTWTTSIDNQLSCTGVIIIPVSGCIALGTYWPTQPKAMVKIQTKINTPVVSRYFYGCNITSAIYCPDQSLTFDAGLVTYSQPPISNFDPTNPVEWARTIIVGLYFNGASVPANINSLGIKCDLMIMVPS